MVKTIVIESVDRLIEKHGFVPLLEALAECAQHQAEIASIKQMSTPPMWWTLAAHLLAGIAKGLKETW